MKITTLRLLLVTFSLASLNSFAQKSPNPVIFGKTISQKSADGHIRCVSNEYEATLQQKYSKRASTEEFENWLSEKMEIIKVQKTLSGNTTNSTNLVVNLPVVVHVIHDGDAKGTNENISDEQVLSQIAVLNQDYRKMVGTPGYNNNSVGADMEIQFVMARRTPTGDDTNGINRVNLNVPSWNNEDAIEEILKVQTQWDPTKYINIWVCNFGGDMADILGYAQFPSNSGLGGLSINGGIAKTDGVVIGYQYFGSSDIYPNGTYADGYDKGRTTTHEVGHFFGLRHIWGDSSSCTVNATDSNNDYCLDTPAASAANYDCVTNNSCPSPGNDMIENYMDYTPDSCMNIFTLNQKARTQAVITNSPRRFSLTTSLGGTPLPTYPLDGRIEITSLNVGCETNFSPTLLLVNKGTTTLTSAQISYTVDNGTAQLHNWTGSLATGASAVINLNSIVAANGPHTFNLNLTTVNGGNDDNTANNSRSETFNIANYQTEQVVLTLQQDTYGSETSWEIYNAAGTVLYQGGPYNDTASLPAVITQTFNLPVNGCYTFAIYDDYGDGICCSEGNGYYNLKTTNNTIIVSGSNFGGMAKSTFGTTDGLGVGTKNTFDAIFVYPNPASSMLTISIPNSAELPDSYVVYNSLGQELKSTKVLSENNLNLNISGWANGVYFIKISKDDKTKTLRFIKK